jgi:hypothetical protein
MLKTNYMDLSMENRQNKVYRYERKFFIQNLDKHYVESLILQHHAMFKKVYYPRYINNIYFDNLEFSNFMDNINGNTNRIKYRVRWYGEMLGAIKDPILELKIKNGLVGTKDLHPLEDFKLENRVSLPTLKAKILNSDLDLNVKFNIKNQYPMMLNRYKRKYFESYDKKFRITIDDQQSFFKINHISNSFLTKIEDNNNLILELKYNKCFDREASKISNAFPFRLTKSSKYSRGIEMLYF